MCEPGSDMRWTQQAVRDNTNSRNAPQTETITGAPSLCQGWSPSQSASPGLERRGGDSQLPTGHILQLCGCHVSFVTTGLPPANRHNQGGNLKPTDKHGLAWTGLDPFRWTGRSLSLVISSISLVPVTSQCIMAGLILLSRH